MYIPQNQMCYTVVVIDPLQNSRSPLTARTAIVTLDKEEAIGYCEREMDYLEREGYVYTGEYPEGSGKSTVIYDKPGFTAAVILQKSGLVQK